MKRRTASCPACGAPVMFPIGSVVAVCDFCQTAVGRRDREVEDYGKVADLIETSTRLQRGLTGTVNNKEFTIRGRVQYRHPAGGVWDEWYLALPGGRWGWLAEAQGNTYLMFEKRLKSGAKLPDFDKMEVGEEVQLAGSTFAVKERGTAESAAAEGEIPWAFRSGAEHRFVDMEDSEGRFATLEYGDKPHLYVGQSVELDDLKLVGQGWHMDEEKIATSAAQINCPKCGGPITLRVPDQSLRVTCPNCQSLLDAQHGKLSYLKTLKSKEQFPIVIPLGSEGELFGKKYTVIGYMRRYATWQGKTFPWNEYLLYEPKMGFRWLVQNEQHWSFVEPPRSKKSISPKKAKAKTIDYGGQQFRVYDRGYAYVRYVIGEFYWKVEVGEKVRTADFIAPPRMLSFEWSKTGKSEEVNISMGTYLAVDEVEKAFGVKVNRPWGVGTIQPGPWPGWGAFIAWPAFALVLLITYGIFRKPGLTGADGWLCFYGLLMLGLGPLVAGVLDYFFEVKRWENSDFSPYAKG